MEATSARLLPVSLLFLPLIISSAIADNPGDLKHSLIAFLQKLSPTNYSNIAHDLGWNATSDPCLDRWRGISCKISSSSIRSVVLEFLNLDGSIDANVLSLLCNSNGSLKVLSLKYNSLTGDIPPEITGCSQLTHLYLSNNRFSGSLPSSLPNLRNLKRLDISHNNFSGDLPRNLSMISGLFTFLADRNHFTGTIPEFDLYYFKQFNVSFNQFSGPVPLNSEKFPIWSFFGNPGLCGQPLPVTCPPPSPPSKPKSNNITTNTTIMITGYVLFGLVFILLVHTFLKQKKKSDHPLKEESGEKVSEISGQQGTASHSEYSISSSSVNSGAAGVSNSLVVLKKVESKELRFEALLRAPAELLGKGRFGSLYKVVIDGGAELAVKRIKDWKMSGEEFGKKIMRMDQVKHPNVLPVTAFYCSKQEKLVVYEFQKNGSLFQLLHDNSEGRPFSWASRLNVAAGVSAGLSFMHQSLGNTRNAAAAAAVGHGNLKSSNILLSASMEALISEHGLTSIPIHRPDSKAADAEEHFSPSADVYALGIILLELLTGKPTHGFNLAQWVHSVVREEWTVEVFDSSLLADASDIERAEEAMVRLLKVALQCINNSPDARPAMARVAMTIARMRDAEVRGEPGLVDYSLS